MQAQQQLKWKRWARGFEKYLVQSEISIIVSLALQKVERGARGGEGAASQKKAASNGGVLTTCTVKNIAQGYERIHTARGRTLATSEEPLPPWPPPLECLDLEAVDISVVEGQMQLSRCGSLYYFRPLNFKAPVPVNTRVGCRASLEEREFVPLLIRQPRNTEERRIQPQLFCRRSALPT